MEQELCTLEFKPSSDFNNVEVYELLTAPWQKLLAAILTGARILTAEAMKCFRRSQDYGNFQRNNWLYLAKM